MDQTNESDGEDSTVIKIEPVIIIENEPMIYSSNEDLTNENTTQANQITENDDEKSESVSILVILRVFFSFESFIISFQAIENDSEEKPKRPQRTRRSTQKSDEKRFTCDSCDSSFHHASNLHAHKKVVHKGIRPHSCKICDKRFPNAFSLKRHTISHTSTLKFLFFLLSKYTIY